MREEMQIGFNIKKKVNKKLRKEIRVREEECRKTVNV